MHENEPAQNGSKEVLHTVPTILADDKSVSLFVYLFIYLFIHRAEYSISLSAPRTPPPTLLTRLFG